MSDTDHIRTAGSAPGSALPQKTGETRAAGDRTTYDYALTTGRAARERYPRPMWWARVENTTHYAVGSGYSERDAIANAITNADWWAS